MKKLFFLASLCFTNFLGFAQVTPADYDNSALDKTLNDSINKYYSVTSHQLKQVAGLEVIDSSLLNTRRWWNNQSSNLYNLSFNSMNELEVEFNRANGGAANYEDFNLIWAGWGKQAFLHTSRTDLYPFPFKVTGTATKPIYTPVPAAEQDTLYGYAVNLHESPVVRMKVSCTKPTNIRVDLIDKNRRVANVIAPHHVIETANQDTYLEFRWDFRPLDDNGTESWTYEDPTTDDHNIGIAADGWSGKWWDVDAGRNEPLTPLLAGRTAWTGAVVLDLKNIVGVAITLEDGSITADNGYGATDNKTLTIKELIVGSNSNYVALNRAELTSPTGQTQTGGGTTDPNTIGKIVSITPNQVYAGEMQTIQIVTSGISFGSSMPLIDVKNIYGETPENAYVTAINDSVLDVFIYPRQSRLGEYTVSINNAGKIYNGGLISVINRPVLVPTITSISPSTITQGETLAVTISVANASFRTSAPSYVNFQQASSTVFSSNNVTVIDDQNLSVSVSTNYGTRVGQYDLSFYYYQNYSTYRWMFASNAIQVKESLTKPELTSITPAVAKQGDRLDVVISGKNCNFLQASSSVNRSVSLLNADGYQVSASYNFTALTNNSLLVSFVIPRNAPAGKYSVKIIDNSYSYGYYEYYYPGLQNAFTIEINNNLPRLTKIDAQYAQQGEKLVVTLSGYNTQFSQQTPTLKFKQSSNSTATDQSSDYFYANADIKVLSDTKLEATVDVPRKANLGYYDVSVYDYDSEEKLVLNRGFIVTENPNRPHLVSISQTSAKQGDLIELSITAKDIKFSFASRIYVIIGKGWSYVESKSVKVIDENTIVATIQIPDNMPAGASDIYVLNTTFYENTEFYEYKNGLTIDEVTKTAQEVSDLSTPSSDAEILVYPSITTGLFTLVAPEAAQVELVSQLGSKTTLTTATIETKSTYDISSLAAGMYKVVIRSNDSVTVLTVIKQ